MPADWPEAHMWPSTSPSQCQPRPFDVAPSFLTHNGGGAGDDFYDLTRSVTCEASGRINCQTPLRKSLSSGENLGNFFFFFFFFGRPIFIAMCADQLSRKWVLTSLASALARQMLFKEMNLHFHWTKIKKLPIRSAPLDLLKVKTKKKKMNWNFCDVIEAVQSRKNFRFCWLVSQQEQQIVAFFGQQNYSIHRHLTIRSQPTSLGKKEFF